MPTYFDTEWSRTHQSSVDAILGAGVRKVRVAGTGFSNMDRWTARVLWTRLVQSVKTYGNALTKWTVLDAVRSANRTQVENPHIIVAETPKELAARDQRASIGGDYHEAWHTEWSCRRNLTIEEVWEPLMERWGLVEDWSPYIGAVLHWSNLIEDIRIERLGCRKYPGAPPKMRDLQDLILDMESKGREAAEHRGLKAANDDLSVIMGTFRDLGLGYTSFKQRVALADYKMRSPEGFALVESGALRPMLDRAITMSAEDGLGSFWLAMEVVAALVNLQIDKAPEKDEEGEDTTPPVEFPAPEEEFAPNQGDEEPSGDASAPPSNLPDVPIFKVGDRAMFNGVMVEVTHAGLPDPKTGRQELQFAPVLPD
jgi:hypothetical protein